MRACKVIVLYINNIYSLFLEVLSNIVKYLWMRPITIR